MPQQADDFVFVCFGCIGHHNSVDGAERSRLRKMQCADAGYVDVQCRTVNFDLLLIYF